MKIFDRVIAWLLLALGCLHTAGSVVLMSRNLNLDSAWFFSGGLAVIFCAFLNLIRTYRLDRAIAGTSFLANQLLLILAVLLCWALRHNLKQNPQAIVLVGLVVVELLFSARQWSR